MTEPRYLTINDTAARLSVSRWTILSWLRSRKLASVKLGHVVRIPEADLERLIASGLRPAGDVVRPLSAARRRLAGLGR